VTSGHGLSEAARPFSAGEGPRGVLLIHGFGGTPASMRPWAAHLERHGYAVSVPLLPGHGTAWQDMARPRWTDWFTAVDGALSELRERCETTAVAGISMGAALALLLAVERPRDVSALLLVNPRVANAHRLMFAVPVLQHVIPSIAGDTKPVKKPGVPRVSYERLSVKAVRQMMLLWKELRPRLSEVTQPVIIWRSVADGPAGTLSSEVILGEVRSQERRELLLQDSYHLATLDNDADSIFNESVAFLTAQSRTAQAR
jgi:carboxylesterase